MLMYYPHHKKDSEASWANIPENIEYGQALVLIKHSLYVYVYINNYKSK